jgi:hypothetical protein
MIARNIGFGELTLYPSLGKRGIYLPLLFMREGVRG